HFWVASTTSSSPHEIPGQTRSSSPAPGPSAVPACRPCHRRSRPPGSGWSLHLLSPSSPGRESASVRLVACRSYMSTPRTHMDGQGWPRVWSTELEQERFYL